MVNDETIRISYKGEIFELPLNFLKDVLPPLNGMCETCIYRRRFGNSIDPCGYDSPAKFVDADGEKWNICLFQMPDIQKNICTGEWKDYRLL